ncbi:MFS transporter [Histoplasma capsulatum var. duboisii H88]|uniref:MFS transporter n=1 Tax=Ajellomyces capsulatus (strain H88) TaxID=544711 RepID=F0U942_AJEC8|nr:MFS transporter [Histoplasma capsulatum var. duboisii H88]
MALGVLDDNKLAEVPGTSLLDKGRSDELDTRNLNLKTKHGVVLVPQPSDNVNDPYNWPDIKKNIAIWALALTSGVAVSLGPIISPGLLVASKRYHVSLDQVSTFLIGVLILSIGSGTFFTAAAATIWGKRPVFIISTAILLITCVWGYFATSFESLWIMRIVQGISAAPLETLVTSTVSDIFFVHERGQKLAIWGIAITSGVILSQVVSGYIIQNLGLLTPFGITALVLCLLLPAIFFLVPETADVLHKSGQTNEKLTTAHGGKNAPKRTYSEELKIFNGRISDKSFWALAAKPLPLITFPAVIFSTFIHGSFLTWLVVFAILSTNVFTGPQYGLTPSQIGLTNLPLLGVCLLGTPLSGAIADWLVCLMARRNNGIYEPEFRLLLMIPATIFSTAGFIGYGLSIDRGAAVAVPVTFMALHSLSIPFATSASFTYVIDCHPKDANQAFVTINFAKAVFIFIASMFVNGWYSARGPRVVFTWITGLNLAFSMMTIPILRGVPLSTNFEVNTYISTITTSSRTDVRKIGCE